MQNLFQLHDGHRFEIFGGRPTAIEKLSAQLETPTHLRTEWTHLRSTYLSTGWRPRRCYQLLLTRPILYRSNVPLSLTTARSVVNEAAYDSYWPENRKDFNSSFQPFIAAVNRRVGETYDENGAFTTYWLLAL